MEGLGELRSFALPRLTWDADLIESLGLVLPPSVRDFWDGASGLVMFADMAHGQWGLVIWSPDQAYVRHQRYASPRPTEYRTGDLLIGEFLGDSDLLLVRCEPGASDFGSIMVALPLDPRPVWPTVAGTLEEFIERFLEARGEKYWETHGEARRHEPSDAR